MSFNVTLAEQKILGIALVLAFFMALSLAPGHAHAAAVTLVSSTVTSNNASTTLAKIGDTVTFGLTLSGTPAATTTPTINIFSLGAVNMTGSGTTWSYATTSSSAWTSGFLTFAQAWGGTVGEATTTITQTSLTGTNVRFDKTAPTISSITSSASCTGSICSPGNTITFTLTPGATEYGATVTGSYNSRALTWSTSNAGATYTAVYTAGRGDSSTGLAVQISGVILTDAAGNASSAGAGSDVTATISANSHRPVVIITGSSNDSSSESTAPVTTTTQTSTETTSTTPASTTTGSTTSSPAAVMKFVRDLQLGANNSDVKALQAFLNSHGYAIVASGPGSKGSETSFFGGLTQTALAKFQAAKGISPARGFFGPKTRAFISGMQ
ncbi:MAG: parallel beta-helix repeat-containing protein [Parcubacteria group bacterium]|nr:parallel beta-helix repeat-containing protein [Parcubacteria group bacterium]